MNFLAHSLLGFEDPDLIAGQICGDFVKGSQLSHFPTGVERGIRLHRYLDVYADSHPIFHDTRQSISGLPRRFAGIVIDVLFDHYLARNWSAVSHLSLSTHAQNVDAALARHHDILPAALQRFRRVMSREAILERNIDMLAIEKTLRHLSTRSSRFSALAIDQSQLQSLSNQLESPFKAFYPELHAAAHTYMSTPASEFQP